MHQLQRPVLNDLGRTIGLFNLKVSLLLDKVYDHLNETEGTEADRGGGGGGGGSGAGGGDEGGIELGQLVRLKVSVDSLEGDAQELAWLLAAGSGSSGADPLPRSGNGLIIEGGKGRAFLQNDADGLPLGTKSRVQVEHHRYLFARVCFYRTAHTVDIPLPPADNLRQVSTLHECANTDATAHGRIVSVPSTDHTTHHYTRSTATVRCFPSVIRRS